jgi:TetR/AcrR family transcriptional regulator, transcriptional repressor of bet genes
MVRELTRNRGQSVTKSENNQRRALPKEVRKEQLIRATVKCIARHGLSGVTMARVTQEAGLSLGIANLHFKSKDKLLLETLKYVTDEYGSGQAAILEDQTFPTIAAKIEALLDFDFSPGVTDRNKLAVWFAFLGEAKSRPTYQRICSRQDSVAEQKVTALFQQAIEEAGYANTDAALLASGYISLVDGLWLNTLVAPRRLGKKKAYRAARHYLASAFPQHIRLDP